MFIEIYIVYILYSPSLRKFYTGFTSSIEQRMSFHNNGMNSFAKKGVPWEVIITFEIADKSAARLLEKQIKKSGARRYLERNNPRRRYTAIFN